VASFNIQAGQQGFIHALFIFITGTAVPAGIFIPSLLIGASYGRFVGEFIRWVQLNMPNSWLFNECTE